MSLDWAFIFNEVVALLIVWLPAEILVIGLVVTIWRKTNKLAASMEMLPQLSEEERRFVRWWGLKAIRDEMELKAEMHQGEKPWD